MIADDRFERLVSVWLHADAEHRVPDHLEAVLRLTRSERQRPAWSSLERWLPMDSTMTRRLAPPLPRPALSVLVALLVLIVLATAILIAGSRPRLDPYGPARVGLVAYDDRGDIFLRDPLTDERTPVTSGPEWDGLPGFSPDGTKLGFLRRATRISADGTVMVGNADGTGIRAVSEPLFDIWSGAWSGDGAFIALSSANVATDATDDYAITVIDIERGTSQLLELGMSVESVGWIPPLGQELMFRGLRGVLPDAVWAVRPDGTGLRPLTPMDGVPGEGYQEPAISADGRQLGYSSWSGSELKMHAYVRNLADGTLWRAPNPDAKSDLTFQRFSPDDSSVLLSRQLRDSDPPTFGGVIQFLVVPVGGSDPVFLGQEYRFESPDTRPDLEVGITVDGSAVLLLDRGKGELWTLPVDGRDGTAEPWHGGDLPALQRVAIERQPPGRPCPGLGCR